MRAYIPMAEARGFTPHFGKYAYKAALQQSKITPTSVNKWMAASSTLGFGVLMMLSHNC